MDQIIVPACYFGPVELYTQIAQSKTVYVDLGEHFVRKSMRTRTKIVGPNGVQILSTHIERTHTKTPMHAMRMSYTEDWRQEHWHAIKSAYGQSVWFIHYADEVKDLILSNEKSLSERNLAIMKAMLRLCQLPVELQVSKTYLNVNSNLLDLRSRLTPTAQRLLEYRQVFLTKHGFLTGMSILDLLFNMGPETPIILKG